MLTGGSAGLSEMAGGGERGVGAVFERRGASMYPPLGCSTPLMVYRSPSGEE